MKLLCINTKNINLTYNIYYYIIKIRKWNNGYVQYLVKDDNGFENWFSKRRFSNRKEKIEALNKIIIPDN